MVESGPARSLAAELVQLTAKHVGDESDQILGRQANVVSSGSRSVRSDAPTHAPGNPLQSQSMLVMA